VIRKAVEEQSQAWPLSTVQTGGKARLVRVDAGRGLNNRLASLGFVPDVEISVVSNGHPGPFVVIIKDVKMALGRGVANKILVKSA
jgi:ferrous iron transport protein A